MYSWSINPVKMACNLFLKQRTSIVLNEILGGKSQKTLLDLGCGSGDLGIALAKKFQKVILSDYSEGMLNLAESRASGENNITIRCNDAKVLPFDTNSIDNIIAIGLLDYVDKIETVIKELARVSQRGTTLVITSPKSPTIFQFLRVSSAFRKSVSGLPPIVNSLTRDEFENLLQSHNFKIVKMRALWDAMWIITAKKA